jgi:hypothetical protein
LADRQEVAMKTSSTLAVLSTAVLAVACLGAGEAPLPLAANEPVAAVAPAGASAPLTAALDAIRRAPDPSAAVQAYAAAPHNTVNDPQLEQAYVERMATLGLPELAATQAQDLARRQPNDGMAWGVVAYMEAKAGRTDLALTDIVAAARYAPKDPFVQRTAGELLAWYDARGDKSQITQSLQVALETLRGTLAATDAYKDGYAQAVKAYSEASNTNAPPPVPTPTEAVVPTEPSYDAGATYSPYNPYPYYYPTSIYLAPCAVDTLYPPCDSYWWPTFGTVAVFPFYDHFHNGDHHHDGGGFHGGSGSAWAGNRFGAGTWSGAAASLSPAASTPIRPSSVFVSSGPLHNAPAFSASPAAPRWAPTSAAPSVFRSAPVYNAAPVIASDAPVRSFGPVFYSAPSFRSAPAFQAAPSFNSAPAFRSYSGSGSMGGRGGGGRR